MRLIRGILFSSVLVLFGIAAGAAQAGTLPADASLEASSSVSWPDQKEFEYRLTVKAGPEGADFNLSFDHPGWGLDGVDGTFVSMDEASLVGPGKLGLVSTSVADPVPTACFRGGFGSVNHSYNVKLGPGEETTVAVPARLLAAPLAGMNAKISATLSDDQAEPLELEAPLSIGGTEGVRIRIESSRIKARNWQRFTLTGQTFPALPNRWLQVRAEPRIHSGKGRIPKAHVILSVRTDKEGAFRSRPVHLGHDATWVLTSRLMSPGGYDAGSSCNGTVETIDGWYRPEWIDLKDFSFISTKIKGRDLGTRKRYDRQGKVRAVSKIRLRLSFSLGRRYSENIPDWQDWPLVPSVSPYVGCNRMGGEVTVKNGLIRTEGSFFSTAMMCFPFNDGWIVGLLSKGLQAKMKNRILILERGNTRITMKRRF